MGEETKTYKLLELGGPIYPADNLYPADNVFPGPSHYGGWTASFAGAPKVAEQAMFDIVGATALANIREGYFSIFSVCDNALKEMLDDTVESFTNPFGIYPSDSLYPSGDLYPSPITPKMILQQG